MKTKAKTVTRLESCSLKSELLQVATTGERGEAWRSRSFTFGRVAIAAEDRSGELAEAARPWPTLEFPRSFVRFHPGAGPAFVADPTVAVLHDPGRPFEREVLSDAETLCDWIAVDPSKLFEIRPDLAEWWPRFFPARHVPACAQAFFLLRHASWYAVEGEPAPALMEETLLRIVDLVVGKNASGAGHLLRVPTPAELALAEKVKLLLLAEPGGKHTVESIALQVGCSQFYLWRAFRRAAGQTLHEYLTQLRLRGAWEEVCDPRSDLAAIALDQGFSSHSHFTASFRRTFGITPSGLRKSAASVDGRTLRRLLATSYGTAGG